MVDTDTLIRRLAAEAGRPAPAGRMASRLAVAVMTGGLAVLLILVLGLGLHVDVALALTSASVLLKCAAALAFGGLAFVLLTRVAQPGRPLVGSGPLVPALAAAAMAVLLGSVSFSSGAATSIGSPVQCVAAIAVLAMMPLALILGVLRSGAATRPGWAGALAGVLAGAVASFGYAFYCPVEIGAAVLTWYGVALAAVAALGALVGSRLLAW